VGADSSEGYFSTQGDMVTLKYNNNGSLLWSKIYNGGFGSDKGDCIIADSAGNAYVTGRSRGNGTRTDIVTIKYNPNGDSLWVKRFNGTMDSTDFPVTIALDRFQNVYVAGNSLVTGNKNKLITLKYTNSGSLAWSKLFTGVVDSSDYATGYGPCMLIDTLLNVYITGWSTGNGTGQDAIMTKYLQPPFFDPSNLTATGVSLNRINLSWNDNSYTETKFRIERSTNAGTNWILRDSVNANVTAYADTGLAANTIYYYRLFASNQAGNSGYSNMAFDTTLNVTGIKQISGNIPKLFKLYLNYPNPFNPSTRLRFDIPKEALTRLTVYDITGRKVSELVDKQLTAGAYEVLFDASNLSSGAYFYKIEAGTFSDVKKMVLIK
jgi:hypothetical protein